MNDYVGNRSALRINYKLKVRIKGRKLKETEYQTDDISANGAFISSDSAPPLGLAVDIKLYLPGLKKALQIKGKILRIKWFRKFEHVEGFALEFKKMNRETEDKLLNFLNKVSRGEL